MNSLATAIDGVLRGALAQLEAFDMLDTKQNHLHIHLYEDRTALAAVTTGIAVLNESVQQLKETIMASQAQFDAAFQRINTATNTVADLLRKYAEDKRSGGMTEEQENAALKQFEQAASSLEQMGQSQQDPVPQEPPPVDTTGAAGASGNASAGADGSSSPSSDDTSAGQPTT